jgi:hypothetical protein
MGVENNYLLTGLLHQLPARSARHRVMLTTWLLSIESDPKYDQTRRDTFRKKIKAAEWKLDLPTLRKLIQHGDEFERFHLLSSSIWDLLPRKMFEDLWRRCFKKSGKDEWRHYILADLLQAHHTESEFRRIGHFKKELDFFMRHRSDRVRWRAMIPSVFLNPPEPKYFLGLKKGLTHNHDGLRLDCVNALIYLLHPERKQPPSKQTVQIIRNLNIRPILKKLRKDKIVGANIPTLEQRLSEHGL